jgi:hypothetical protein
MKRLGSVQLLDEDPTLLELLSAHEQPAARRALSATVYSIPAGPWHPDPLTAKGDPHLGLLVLDGLLIRDVSVASTTCGELVGPGELLRPWDAFGERAPMPLEIEWKALVPLRIAVLDHEFAAVLASWPALVHAFIERAVERSLSLALHVAIASAASTSACSCCSPTSPTGSARSPGLASSSPSSSPTKISASS